MWEILQDSIALDWSLDGSSAEWVPEHKPLKALRLTRGGLRTRIELQVSKEAGIKDESGIKDYRAEKANQVNWVGCQSNKNEHK